MPDCKFYYEFLFAEDQRVWTREEVATLSRIIRHDWLLGEAERTDLLRQAAAKGEALQTTTEGQHP